MLRFVDSFDHYATADITKKYTANTLGSIVASGRYGSCMRVDYAGGEVTKTLTSQSTWIVGFAHKYEIAGGLTGECRLLYISDGSTKQITVTRMEDGRLRVYTGDSASGGTLRGTGTAVLAEDSWYYIEVKVVIAAAGSIVVRVEGTEDINVSGIDTDVSNSGTAASILLRSGGVSQQYYNYFDDYYVCDASGGINDDFLGDVRVEALFPASDSTEQVWSPLGAGLHYVEVDEALQDGNTSYVSSGTQFSQDSFLMNPLSYANGTVYGVMVSACAKKQDAGVPRNIQLNVQVDPETGSGQLGAVHVVAGGDYRYYSDVFDDAPDPTPPGADVPWTVAYVNDLECGIYLET